MKTIKLLLIFSAFFISAAAFAQGRQVGKALKSARTAVTPVRIKPISVPRVPAVSPARFQAQYTKALQAVENAAKELSAPVELTYTKKPVVIGAPDASNQINVLTRKKIALTQAQQQADQALYDWGESLAQTHQLGYQTAPRVTAAQNGEAVLTINGQSAFIRTAPAHTGETVITPAEIGVNADALKAATAPFTKDVIFAVWNDAPEKAAGFFYLQRNFTDSLEEFQAAADAFFSLPKGKMEWLTGPSEQTKLVRQNYHYAAANLAVSSAELLKFMSLHPAACSGPLESYKTIMRLNNQNANTPAVFQNFWEKPLSI